MKALTFLQLWELSYDKLLDYYRILGIKNHNIGELHFVLKQSFKPEMITEYFEGWKFGNQKLGETNPVTTIPEPLFYNTNGDQIIINDFIEIYSKENGDVTEFPYPENLDDFIRYCQVVGIELILKGKDK